MVEELIGMPVAGQSEKLPCEGGFKPSRQDTTNRFTKIDEEPDEIGTGGQTDRNIHFANPLDVT